MDALGRERITASGPDGSACKGAACCATGLRLVGRGTVLGAVAGAVTGAVVGCVVGVVAYLPTAPFAAIEGGIGGLVVGALFGLVSSLLLAAFVARISTTVVARGVAGATSFGCGSVLDGWLLAPAGTDRQVVLILGLAFSGGCFAIGWLLGPKTVFGRAVDWKGAWRYDHDTRPAPGRHVGEP